MNIGIIGKGVVGTAVYDGLKHLGHSMSFFDSKYKDSKIEDVLNTDCVFVSVPTNQKDNGDCDVSIVQSVVKDLNDKNYKGIVAIKSTVVPGTTENLSYKYPSLKLCSVPEFLRAKTALADFMHNHDLLVIGSTRKEDFELMIKIHGNLPKNIACVKPTEAELIKYFNNVNHSMQIIFANIFYDICKKMNVDYDQVYNSITKRDCFNPAYLMCNENLRGFGGHCLPKDTNALANFIDTLGLNYSTIRSVLSDNEKINNG